MTKKKTYENICKNYENSKRQKPYKTCRFLVFSVEKQGSRDGPGTPGTGLPETDFHSKTCTKVDFLIKPNIKKIQKQSTGTKLCL